MRHCRLTVKHLTRSRWLLPCWYRKLWRTHGMTNEQKKNKKKTNNKVPKRKVNTIETRQHKICSDVTDWSSDGSTLAHFLQRNTCPFITLNCPNISCLCLQPAAPLASLNEKRERGKKKKPTTPEQNTEGSPPVEEDKIAGLGAARLLLRERILENSPVRREANTVQAAATTTR